MNFMKVYPARFWGDDVTIIANEAALLQLKKIIDAALTNQRDYGYEEFFGDDSKYSVEIKCLSEEATIAALDALPPHYDDGDVKLTQEEVTIIYDFMKDDNE